MKKSKLLILAAFIACICTACKKEPEEISDLDKIKYNNKKSSYPTVKMDSAQSIVLQNKKSKNCWIYRPFMLPAIKIRK